MVKPAWCHFDANLDAHQMIGILDLSIAHRVSEFPAAIVGDSVEFYQPMLEARIVN